MAVCTISMLTIERHPLIYLIEGHFCEDIPLYLLAIWLYHRLAILQRIALCNELIVLHFRIAWNYSINKPRPWPVPASPFCLVMSITLSSGVKKALFIPRVDTGGRQRQK